MWRAIVHLALVACVRCVSSLEVRAKRRSCNGAFEMLLSRSACFCVKTLEPMETRIHNNREYIFDGYMPPELEGGVYLQPPHYIWWQEQVTLELRASAGAAASVYVFYNDDTFQSGPLNGVHRYSGGLHQVLSDLGWEGPFSGPQYDVLSGSSHGMTMAMWRLNITADSSGVGFTTFELTGSEDPWQPAVMGIAVNGPCEVQVPSFSSCRVNATDVAEESARHGPEVPTEAVCSSVYAVEPVSMSARFSSPGFG